jgi:soluble lytic murein transglycosylase-like protein
LTFRHPSRIVAAMRVAVWGALLGVAVATTAAADIYSYRDRSGAIVFTNAPVERATRLAIREPPIPAAPRMVVPLSRERVLAELAKPIPVPVPTSYDPLIREIADRYDVEYALVKAVIKAESDFDRMAVSRKGALGLMQLMPETAAQHMVRDVFLPRDNIEGGCRHLRMLLDRYGGNLPLTIAAYNAGTRRVEEAGGVPAIPETREYLARVLRYRLAYLREGVGVVALRR